MRISYLGLFTLGSDFCYCTSSLYSLNIRKCNVLSKKLFVLNYLILLKYKIVECVHLELVMTTQHVRITLLAFQLICLIINLSISVINIAKLTITAQNKKAGA